MKTTIEERLTSLLKSLPTYWENEQLNKIKVIEAIRNYDEQLMKLLLSDDLIRTTYSTEIGGTVIFKQQEFVDFFRYKDYWDSSYTRYSNEIGLTTEGRYLKYNSDVVLDFPFKDTIFEGGMSKEDIAKNEVYYHTVIAKQEIDIMLSEKVLSRSKRIDKHGEQEIKEFDNKDNLILKGNNLVALHTLKKRYVGQVRLIYIDPPYNTGGDSFKYNDRFNHSTWLTFMKNRLEIMKELLSDDGSIWINIDDKEGHYLKVLCDEIFGRNNFISTIVWRSSDNSNNDAKRFSQDHNYILVYSKKEGWLPNKVERSEEQAKHYTNPDNDPRGPWFDGNPISSPNPRPNLRYNIIAPNGNIITPPAFGWRWSEETLKEKMATGEIRFNETFTNIKRRTYLKEQKGIPASTLWANLEETGHNRQAKYEQKHLFSDRSKEEWFSTPKPERLIKKILEIGSNSGDLVLDGFVGSATTAAVAHKMNRQYIGIEQMDYIETITIERMKKVIEGEQGGISKDVDWQGGGSFVYAELLESNQLFINKIMNISTDESLVKFVCEIKDKAFFNFKVELDKLINNILTNDELSLEDKKKLVLESLDNNQNYVAYSEIDDVLFAISEQTKEFNHSFYKKEVGNGNE
ncbi:DNA methyltransferase [Neobacillus sp. C211]|uniref:DNA methyltransferase n=1 Tax=unclassified Neobacillus TaxID=2675272 RepID=UPI00397CCEC4